MVSDIYIVNSLLLDTSSGRIIWHRNEGSNNGLFLGSLNEGTENRVDLRIYMIRWRAPSQIHLEFLSLKRKRSGKFHKVTIVEPLPGGYFEKSYITEDQQNLAEIIKKLYKSVVSQCINRESEGSKNEDQIRQEIYGQILNSKNPE